MKDIKNMEALCQDTHLNSPLSVTLLNEALKTRHEGSRPRNQAVKNLIYEIDSISHLSNIGFEGFVENQEIQRVLGDIYQWGLKCDVSTHSEQRYTELWAGLNSYVPPSLQALNVLNNEECAEIEEIIEDLGNPVDNPHLLSLYEMREFFEGGVCLSSKPKKFLNKENCKIYPGWDLKGEDCSKSLIVHGFKKDKYHTIEVFISIRVCLLILDGTHYLVSRNHFLMISDIISQRSIIHNACIISAKLKKINYPSEEEVKILFQFGDLLLKRYGNNAYTSLSLWESLCIGEILSRKEDPATSHVDFINKMMEEFLLSQGEEEVDWMGEFYEFWIEPLLSHARNECIFQLFGLYRLWGHPTINELEGVRKLKSIACRQRVVNHHIIDKITFKWREYFCMSYFQKHKKWPQLVIVEKAPSTPLIKALREGVNISPYTAGYNLNDWKYITFEKTFEVPEKFELSEMISDKALSLNIDDLIEECKKGSIGASYHRNVILKWLDTNYNNPQEFLNKIDLEGFDKREVVVGVHPKERELKLFARLFGLLTIEKRLYVVVTEAMLADYLFEYFPEITMTFDSITLQTKIHNNTLKQSEQNKKSSRDSNQHSVIVNMDFNKWNSYMREEETIKIFRDFDHLFGFKNVFCRTHEMFKNSIMYLADGTITPFTKDGKMTISEGVWTGHLGGIEGLRQKGWTIFTVIILKYISELEGVDCQIMGQGDNQVLIITYSLESNLDVKSQHDHFIQSLDNLLTYIGPPLKKEETWSSSYFFIYGKFPVYMGKPMSMSLKKLCRTMRLTNEGFQNLESTLSSITANSSAATASDYDPLIPYIIGSFETLGAIRLHLEFPFYSKFPLSNLNKKSFLIPQDGQSQVIRIGVTDYWNVSVNKRSPWLLISLAIQPCILGGYPTLQLCDLMNHGFPDPLSLNLWSLRSLYTNLKEPYHKLRYIINNILNPIVNNHVNPELICQDPVSLNLLKPSSGTEKIKSAVFDFMTNSLNVKNQNFITFLRLAKSRQKDLSGILFSMAPMNPRIANSIISSTIVGRAMKVVSKVNKTATIIGLMLKYKEAENRKEMESIEADLDLPEGYLKRKLTTAELFGKFEENYLKGVLYQLLQIRIPLGIEEIMSCSTSRAYALRRKSWGKPITGVTVCVPQECFKWGCSDGSDCKLQNHENPSLGFIMVRSSISLSVLGQYNYHFSQLPIGPYKPYFGSRTKNKVKYEGGDLKITAPPILRGILDCMALIGWGTTADSNLSELLRAIFLSFTDLNPDYIIPDISSISGSVEHRWQDMRTSHYSSISILYDLLTHMTVCTNYFRPELYFTNIGTDNFNVSFQTIFTWIGSIWSYLLSNHKVTSTCYHLHVQCSECIKPINEDMIDIDDPTEVIQRIEDSKDENNPYCWIPSESLLGGTKLSIPFSWRKQEFLDDSPERILTWGTIAYYFNNFPLFVSETVYNSRVFETSEVIPISVAFVINIYDFLRDTVGFTILSYSLLRSAALVRRANKDIKVIMGEVRDTLNDLPTSWFRGMISLALNQDGMLTLIKKIPGLVLPKGTPPSIIERCIFFKKAFSIILLRDFNGNGFSSWLDNIIECNYSLYSDFLQFNPLLWSCFKVALSNNLMESQRGMSMISLIRLIFVSTHSNTLLNSNSNLISLIPSLNLVNEQKWILPEFCLISQENLDRQGVCYSGVIDKMSKILKSRRIKIEETKGKTTEDPFDSLIIDPRLVPSACSLLIKYQSSDIPHLGDTRLDPVQLIPNSKSLLNHYHKRSGMITTAVYKLLSIMHELKDKILGINNENNRCYCVGDGVGGYTTLLGRIFPRCKLFYNTLFEVENLSSSGLDDYIPSAIGMFPTILSRIENIQEVIESCSDLTDSSILDNSSFQSNNIKLIVSDAEGGGWGEPEKGILMLRNLLELASRNRTGILIFKSYASRLDALYTQLILTSNYYKRVEIFRSQFSSIGNTEVFIVGTHIRSHVGRLDVSIITENSVNSLFLSGNCKISFSLTKFCSLFHSDSFEKDCIQKASMYSEVLKVKEWEEGAMFNLLSRLGLNTEERFNFPESLIYKWRREFNLIRFTRTRASHLKLNFVSKSVLGKMIEQYLLILSILITSREDFIKWENIVLKSYVQIYASVDLSWSLVLTASDSPISQNCVIQKITKILSPASIKSMVVDAGLLTQITLPNIDWGYISLDLWENKFVYDFKNWWKEDKGKYMRIPFTPIRSYSFDPITHEFVPKPLRLDIPLGKKQEEKALELLDWADEIPDDQEIPIDLTQDGKKYLISKSKLRIKISRQTLTLDYLVNKMNST